MDALFPRSDSKKEKEEREQRNTNATNDWQWRWSKDRLNAAEKNGFVVIKKNSEGKWGVYAKEYQNVDRDGNISVKVKLEESGYKESQWESKDFVIAFCKAVVKRPDFFDQDFVKLLERYSEQFLLQG